MIYILCILVWHFCDARYLFLIFGVQDLLVVKLHETALIAPICSLEETPYVQVPACLRK